MTKNKTLCYHLYFHNYDPTGWFSCSQRCSPRKCALSSCHTTGHAGLQFHSIPSSHQHALLWFCHPDHCESRLRDIDGGWRYNYRPNQAKSCYPGASRPHWWDRCTCLSIQCGHDTLRSWLLKSRNSQMTSQRLEQQERLVLWFLLSNHLKDPVIQPPVCRSQPEVRVVH